MWSDFLHAEIMVGPTQEYLDHLQLRFEPVLGHAVKLLAHESIANDRIQHTAKQ